MLVMLIAVGQCMWTTAGAEVEPAAARYISVAYTVQPGDTLFGVARTFYLSGDDYARIAAYNGIANAAGLKAGTTLILPNPIIQGMYEVRAGDTLYAIASRQFTRSGYIRAIMQYNGILDPARGLQTNAVLVIPQPTGNVQHTVQPGDTLYGLSVRYFKPAAYLQFLAAFNDLDPAAPKLLAGQKLAVPNPYYAYSSMPTGASASNAATQSPTAGQTANPSASGPPTTPPAPAAKPQPTQPAQPDAKPAQTAKPSPSAQTLSIRIDLSANKLFVLAGANEDVRGRQRQDEGVDPDRHVRHHYENQKPILLGPQHPRRRSRESARHAVDGARRSEYERHQIRHPRHQRALVHRQVRKRRLHSDAPEGRRMALRRDPDRHECNHRRVAA
ncbi:LysM repeat protein [Paenibacillus methanolicus]|uniref:LysM repeat protein n=1 Tax=Paenibacillus methanolicus TaxID=582686 RepID=A0A5S5BR44_9BACL|nr:LysM repeat protein [Paenibacillus methanolicus]